MAKVEVQIVGNASSLHKALGTATSGTSKLGSVFGSVARIAAGFGVALGAEKLLAFGKDAVTAAAQVQKSTEAIRADFGKSSDKVIAFGENAAKQFGISNQASTAFSAQIGITAKNIGLAHDKAATMDVGLQKLAGSIGLIKGEDPTSVFKTLTLALAGNTRGLKAMGIVITPLNEQLEAQRLGFIGPKGTISSLNAAQKAQVIYGIATKHAGEFQKQAAQHSGDFADQIIILKARLSNLADSIGAKVLPIVSGLVGTLSKISSAPNFTVGVEVLFHGIEKGAKSIAEGIQHALTGSTSTFEIKAPSGKLLGHGSTFSKGIIQNIADGLKGADWSKIGQEVGSGISKSLKISNKVATELANTLAVALDAHSGDFAALGIKTVAKMFIDILDPMFWVHNWRLALDVALAALTIAFAPAKFVDALRAIPFLKWMVVPLEKLGGPLRTVVETLGRGIANGIRDVFPEIGKASEDLGVKIISPLKSLPERALGIVQDMGQFIGRELGNTAREAFAQAMRIGGRIVDGLDNFLGRVGDVASRLVTRIISPFQDLASRILAPVAKAGRTIINAIGGIGGRAFSAGESVGRQIMEGIANGLSGLIGWLEGKISSIASGLLDKAKGILHINSPSMVFSDVVGRGIMEGIAHGITKHAPTAHHALAGAIMPSSFGGSIGVGGSHGGLGQVTHVHVYIDGKEIAPALVRADKNYRRQNAGRPLLSGA